MCGTNDTESTCVSQVALNADYAESGGGPVVIFDATTGRALRTVFDSGLLDGATVCPQTLVYSPDGSLLALQRSIDGADCFHIGFSADNELLQCNAAIFEKAWNETGEHFVTLDNDLRLSVFAFERPQLRT